MNYTSVNSVQIVRLLKSDGSAVFRTQTVVNQWRDTSNDTMALGELNLSVYNSTMLVSHSLVAPGDVRYMAVCPFNFSLSS